MSAEPGAPKIVVRDRRAFREDGTRRPDSEASAPRPDPVPEDGPAPPESPEPAVRGAAADAAPDPGPDAGTPAAGDPTESPASEAPAEDPRFGQLVSWLVSQAAAMLEPAPGDGKEASAPTKEALSGLRMVIGLLEMLEEKTRGRLADADARLLSRILFELRMTWLRETRRPQHTSAGEPAPAVTGASTDAGGR